MNKKGKYINIGIVILGVILLLFVTKFYLFPSKIYNSSDYTALHNKSNHLIEQEKIDDKIMRDIEGYNHNFENPLVIINPYGASPLTAIIAFKTNGNTSFNATLSAKYNGKEIGFNSNNKSVHVIAIYGLYANHENIVTLTNLGTEDTNIVKLNTTGIDLNQFGDVDLNNLPPTDNDMFFLSSKVNKSVFAYDQEGEMRWFLNNNNYKQLTNLSNGNFLLSNLENDEGHSYEIIEIDLLGKVYNFYELEYPYLDNFSVIDEDKVLYASTNGNIIEYNLKEGKISKRVNISEIINDVAVLQLENKKIAINITSLHYNQEDKSTTVGIDYFNSIVNIDHDAKINWIVTKYNAFPSAFDDYMLKPISKYIVYPSENINSKFINNRLYTVSVGSEDDDYISRAMLVYEINNHNKTIKAIWNITDSMPNFEYGDIHAKNNEEVFMFSGSILDENNLLKSDSNIFILNRENKKSFVMKIEGLYNYIEKKPLITDDYNFEKTKVNIYNLNETVDEYTTKNYRRKFKNVKVANLNVEISGNKLITSYNSLEYNIILMSETGKGYVYQSNNNPINFKKPKEDLLILIEDNDTLYNTGYYLKA